MANTTTTVVNSQLTVSEILAQYLGVKINPHRIGKKQVVLCLWLDDHHSSLSVDNDKGVWNRLGACHKGGGYFHPFKDGGCFASLGALHGMHKSGYPEPSDEEEAKQSWSKDLPQNGPSQAQARRTHWSPCSCWAATDCFPYFAGEEMGTEQVW